MQVLDIMSYRGHDEIKYDENDPESIKNVREKILEKLRLGYVLYGAKVGEEYVRVIDLNIIKKAPNKSAFVDEKLMELDRFIISSELERKMLAPVVVGG